jgi:hypothetical protein
MAVVSGARREEEERHGWREKKEGESNVAVLILVQRAAASILADGSEAAHRAVPMLTRSCLCVWRKMMEEEVGWAAVGLRQMRKGGRRNWAAGPIRFKTFFLQNPFSLLYFQNLLQT